MMKHADPPEIEDLSKDDLLRLVGTALGEVLLHYGLWFAETARFRGVETAVEKEHRVLEKYVDTVIKRLGPHLGLTTENGIPRALLEKSEKELREMLVDIGRIWLTGDGLWFQEVEATHGMNAAKEVNDSCWHRFAHVEAYKIRQFLGIGPGAGLEGLCKALNFRVYSSMNAHSSRWEDDHTLLWTMVDCRVQTARRRKGLPDYPCKSAGIVEYTHFAQALDPRITTECVICPPDAVPEGMYCAWKFRIRD
ncbi:MAG: DUF6125 family protein [Thermodesulfobacteriota bacterium]